MIKTMTGKEMTYPVTFRLPLSEYIQVKRKAEERGESMSDVVRRRYEHGRDELEKTGNSDETTP